MNRRDFIKLGVAGAVGTVLAGGVDLKNLNAEEKDYENLKKSKFKKPEHVVLIMKENRSFDHYFGHMDGEVNGQPEYIMEEGITDGIGGCVKPYDLGLNYVTPNRLDPNHSWRALHAAYNNGKMDGYFLNYINYPAKDYSFIMGYYDTKKALKPYYYYAKHYTLCQNYFHSIMSDTLPNRLYQIAGQSGGHLDDSRPEKPFEFPTIFNRMEDSKISWKIYCDGWPNPNNYEHHYLAVIWFESFIKNKKLISKIRPVEEYFADVKNGTLPQFSWIIPHDKNSEHPPHNVRNGMFFTTSFIETLRKSPLFAKSAVFLNWDECGGFYDHVVPPQVDEYGFGMRVPCLIISPFVKKDYKSNVVHEHASILKYVENLWGIEPLTHRDRYADGFTDAFIKLD